MASRWVISSLRTIDVEWDPSQPETTFVVLPGLEAADAMVLFRTATKQISRRLGYLATFMYQPAISGLSPAAGTGTCRSPTWPRARTP